MSINGTLSRFTGATAKFSAVAEIGISANTTAPFNTIGGLSTVQQSITDGLRADGWQVVRVTCAGSDIVLAVVRGSSSDNLKAVATAFKNTVARRSFITLKNVIAERGIWTVSPSSTNTSTPSTQVNVIQQPGPSGVSLFNFEWLSAYSTPYGNLTREAHSNFNKALSEAFPRLKYTTPFSSYVDKSLVAYSKLYALGETRLPPTQTKAKLLQIAADAGIQGLAENIRFSQKSAGELDSGESLFDTKDTVKTPIKSAMDFDEWFREKFDISPGAALPISYAIAIGVGVVVVVAITRR